MKFTAIYSAVRGSLMLKRKMFFWFFNYRSQNNLEYALEEKLNKHYDALVKDFKALEEIRAENVRIFSRIDNARQADPGDTDEFTISLPLFPLRHKTKTRPDQRWRAIEAALRGKLSGTIADDMFATTARTLIRQNGIDIDPKSLSEDPEIVGEQSHTIRRPSNRQQKQKQNQPDQQQN